MLKSVEESQVELTFYKKTGENGEITPKTPPQVALQTTISEKNENEIMQPTKLFDELDSEGKEKETSRLSDSGVDNQSLKRSASEGTMYSLPLDDNEILEDLKGLPDDKLSSGSDTPSTPFTPKDDDDIESSKVDLTTPLINSSKKTNGFLPRVKYAMQKKGFIVSSVSATVLGISAALAYLQDKTKFIAFFTNSSKYITMPVIMIASLFAIISIFFAIKQFRNTEECQIKGENTNETLDEMLKCQPKDKVIKSVRLEYSNGTHSNFALNAWKAKNGFINIDEKVISRTNKIESVINNRPIFTALLTGVVAANIAFPLGLLAIDGVNDVKNFYQNPLNYNVGLSLLIGSGILTLLTVCLGVHYYNKTSCTNLIYSPEEINTENVNKEFIEEIKRKRTDVLGENHSKEAKCSSLTLEQVVIQSHNYPDVVYGVDR